MQNQYEAPRSDVETHESLPPRSTVVAVLFGGLLVDFVGTMLFAGIASAMILGESIADPEAAEILQELRFAIPLGALGVVMTILGGYVAAKWARIRPVWHGAAAGILSFVVASPFLLSPGALDPIWLNAPLLLAHVPLAMFGGKLAHERAA